VLKHKIKPYERGGEILAETPWPEGMHRIAMGIEYKGSEFHGFQLQATGVKTVQQVLEKALSIIADEEIHLICAGRTDSGVHATNQVIHFDTLAVRPEKAWLRGTVAHLPHGVRVRWVKTVSPQFHARFSALNRSYRYLLTDAKTSPALLHDQITWSSRPLNIDAMREAAAHLVGEHDFTSYRATQCQAKSPVKRVHHCHLVRRGDLIILEIQANAFLHHMVRNIVGVLLAIGAGDKPPRWTLDVLNAKDRAQGAVTAKPYGLYLVGVQYPQEFELPVCLPGPLYFTDELGTLPSSM
jgi:tRNA pseudouridine38-40 synthase